MEFYWDKNRTLGELEVERKKLRPNITRSMPDLFRVMAESCGSECRRACSLEYSRRWQTLLLGAMTWHTIYVLCILSTCRVLRYGTWSQLHCDQREFGLKSWWGGSQRGILWDFYQTMARWGSHFYRSLVDQSQVFLIPAFLLFLLLCISALLLLCFFALLLSLSVRFFFAFLASLLFLILCFKRSSTKM